MDTRGRRIGAALFVAAALLVGGALLAMTVPSLAVSGHVRSADGVEIAYADQGNGEVAILFIHGGLADRTFWAPQFTGLGTARRLVAVDLAGHGASGSGRTKWTIAAWAEDVRAVADALKLKRVVLVGNSLGGPVALEAAALLPGRAIGVVGVDTLHDATQRIPDADSRARADAFRKNFPGSCRAMVEALFHPGAEGELKAWAEKAMCSTPRPMAAGMMESFAGYDLTRAFRGAGVPIRAINGDLWPTRIEVNRSVTPDFDAVIMKGAGHYPMLERPSEFDHRLLEIVKALESASAAKAATGARPRG